MRSSSYNTHKMCEALYFYEYVLGIPGPPNFKTVLGSVTHRALEMLAAIKLAEQDNRDSFTIDDMGELRLKDINRSVEKCTDMAFDSYKVSEPNFNWDLSPYKSKQYDKELVGMHPRDICHKWVKQAITADGGYFNPLNHKVIAPEIKFDFEIDEAWAKYEYNINGKKHSGNLRIVGTSDLVVEISKNTYEIIDWKTGSMKNWKTMKPKTYDDFQKEFQILLYGYALDKVFVNKELLFTIFYIRDGGPTTIAIDKKKKEEGLRLIKEKFEQIKHSQYPQKVPQLACTRFCWFGLNKYPGSELSYCNYLSERIEEDGADLVAQAYGNLNKLEKYGDGGGRTDG